MEEPQHMHLFVQKRSLCGLDQRSLVMQNPWMVKYSNKLGIV